MDLKQAAGNLPNPSSEPQKQKFFLVVDDNEGDRVLLKSALEENQVHEKFHFVKSGWELIDILNQATTALLPSPPVLPSLIVLDLYMPRLNGHQTLKMIKDDFRFKKIPVIILTTSHSFQDIVQSYESGANSFLTKPSEYDDLVKLIGLVKDYWLEEVNLPV